MLALFLALVVGVLCYMCCGEILPSATLDNICRSMGLSCIVCNISSILVGAVYRIVHNWWSWMLLVLWALGAHLILQQLPPELSSLTVPGVCKLCGSFIFIIAYKSRRYE